MFRSASGSNKKIYMYKYTKFVNFKLGGLNFFKIYIKYLLRSLCELTRYSICFEFISVSYNVVVWSVGKSFHPNGSRQS